MRQYTARLRYLLALLLPVLFTASCAMGPTLEINPQPIMKEGCKTRPGYSDYGCRSWVDLTTANDHTGMCKSIGGWAFRMSSYYFDEKGLKPRGAKGTYNAHRAKLSCGGNLQLVDGEYYLGTRGATVTVDDTICTSTPNIYVYTEGERRALHRLFTRGAKKGYLPVDSKDYRDEIFYLVNGNTTDMTGRLLFRDGAGGIITPMQYTYVQAARAIEKHCGAMPTSLNITGRWVSGIEWSAEKRKRLPQPFEHLYLGKLVIDSPKTRVVHDNTLRAAKIETDVTIFTRLKGEARFASEVAKMEREEKAARGAAYIYIFASELHRNSPCFDDELSDAAKDVAGCSP